MVQYVHERTRVNIGVLCVPDCAIIYLLLIVTSLKTLSFPKENQLLLNSVQQLDNWSSFDHVNTTKEYLNAESKLFKNLFIYF